MDTKPVALGMLILILGLNYYPLNVIVLSEKLNNPPTYPELSGIVGDNGWYISNVVITFQNETNNICYKVDEGEWINYTTPFALENDGIHVLEWICDGNMSNIEIKIDKTAPLVTNFSVMRIGFFKWKLTENVTDSTSGMNYVDFCVNGQIIARCTTPPYECLWIGFKFMLLWKFRWTGYLIYLPTGQPYDKAGNTLMSPS